MEERKKIQHAKNEIRDYRFLQNEILRLEGQIIRAQTQLEKVQSIRFEQGESSSPSDPYRDNYLRDKINVLQEEFDATKWRVDRITKFLDSLNEDDRIIVTDILVYNKSHLNLATRYYCGEKTIQRRVNRLVLKF